jgi:hypothetical protein
MSDTDDNKSDKDMGQQIIDFIKALVKLTLYMFLYIFIGAATLLISKLADSDILPTDITKYPYYSTSGTRNISYNDNIFITKMPGTEQYQSNKLHISHKYGNNNDYMLIGLFSKIGNSGTRSATCDFFVTVFFSIYAQSFLIYKLIFSSVGKFMSETAIILLGPLIIFAVLMFSMLLIFPCLFIWFYNLGLLFRSNINPTESINPIWVPITLVTPPQYIICLLFAIILLLIGVVLINAMVPILVVCPIISMFSYKVSIDKKVMGVTDITQKVFSYNRYTIGIIYSIIITYAALQTVGIGGAVISVLIFMLCISGAIGSDIFKSITPSNLTPLKQENIFFGGGESKKVTKLLKFLKEKKRKGF